MKATPTWKGAPQYDDKEAGFSFKPKGQIQLDAGYNGFPRGNELRGTVGGLNFQNLGWNSRARRLTIGADGTLPGGFRYSAEFNLAQGSVDYEDIFLAYDFKNSPITAQIGHIYPFSSLETMTSGKFTSFVERAGFTDAFNYNRRLGVAFTANDKKADSWTIQAGIFNQPINDASFTRTGWQASLRGVYSPMLGTTRLHVGANFQHRENTREALGPAIPCAAAQPAHRSALHRHRNVWRRRATMSRGSKSQRSCRASTSRPKRKSFGCATLMTRPSSPPSTRRTTPTTSQPARRSTATQLLGRLCRGRLLLHRRNPRLQERPLRPHQGPAPVQRWRLGRPPAQRPGRLCETCRSRRRQLSSVAAPFYVNGGKQLGYEGSLIWNPTDYVRFMAQYGHLDVTGGPRATVATAGPPPTLGIFPVGTITPANKRKYGVDTFALRAQVDF